MTPRPILLLVLAAALAMLSIACSRSDLAYRHADKLLEHYAWKTVAPDSGQYARWEPLLDAALQRHREQELPLVIAWLDAAAVGVDAGDAQASACLVDGALLLYRRHARLAAELAAPLLAQLDADQVEHLAKYTARRRRDAMDSYLDPDPQRRREAREERVVQRIEKWTGDLDDSQRRLVAEALQRIPDLSADWIAYRAQRSDTLLSMLESGADAETLRGYLDAWWVRREGTPAGTLEQWRVARGEFIGMISDLGATLDERQKQHLLERLADLRDDLAAFLPQGRQTVGLDMVPACAGAPSPAVTTDNPA